MVSTVFKRDRLFKTSLLLIWFLAGLKTIAVIWFFALHFPRFEGDTTALMIGVDRGSSCIHNHSLFCPDLFYFPLFQYIPALLARSLGFTIGSTLHILVFLSVFSFMGLIVTAFSFFYRHGKPHHGGLAVLLILSSPLLWYTSSSFNELSAAWVTMLFCVACLNRSSAWALALLFTLVGITKEVALPFLLIIAALCLGTDFLRYRKSIIKPSFGIFIGAVATVLLTGVFNFWRFQSVINVHNLQPTYLVSSLKQQGLFFLALWFSPNGGLSFFWPTFFGLACWVSYARFKVRENRKNWQEWIPVIGISCILLGLTLGLSRWWAPFGWRAWGSRLTYPWIPGLIILVIHFFSQEIDHLFTFLRAKKKVFYIIASFVCLFSMLQWMPMISKVPFDSFFNPNAECSSTPQIENQTAEYYQCVNNLMWPKKVFLLGQYFYLLFQHTYFFKKTGFSDCRWGAVPDVIEVE